MDRLSSCYFCGAALDATLEERTVVPSSLRPSTDSQQTVVLCVTCQRKLDAVLGTVLDAVDANGDDIRAGDRSDDPVSQSEGSATSGDDLESTLGDDEDILTPVGDDTDDDATDEAADAADASEMQFGDDREAADDDSGSTTDDADADSEDDSEDRSKKPKYTKSRGAGFRREEDGPVDTGPLTGGAFSDDDDDDESDAGSLTGDAFADDDAADADPGGGRSAAGGQSGGPADGGSNSADDGGTGSTGDGGSSSTDDGGNGSTGDGESGQQRDVSMTRLENTKVMRLLENREFPVDRDEFVTVAANAYQVSRDDCDKVIDLAVEHGLLREENGQLYGTDS